jgi:signal transduction histidine kinase/ActR/RegA family two-component response regulator
LKVLGYRPDELVGRGGQDLVFPDDLDPTRAQMRAARKGLGTTNFRCRYIHKDGRPVPIAWLGTWSETDRLHFFIGRDMTEYDRAQEQLQQALKMEAIGQLTGGVAHDFNNILMVIMARIEALEEDERLDPSLRGEVKGITDATERATTLTRQLLAFSRKQPLRPQRANVNDLVAATGRLLRRILGEHIALTSVLADDLPLVEVDRAQLEAALVNLCINARDAMPEGGRLLIETAMVTLDEEYVERDLDVQAGDYVMIGVSDTGIGIPADLVGKVFEPFFTTKEEGKGTGLGLSMVYGFIKQSQGHIKIYSEMGSGTSVKIYLPKYIGAEQAVDTTEKPPLRGGSERILVVEDDEQVRGSVRRHLQSLGYSVAEASSGAGGLAAFEAAVVPYDLLLTDMVMPGSMSGKVLADEVTRRWPATKVVFMSGYTEDALMHQGRLARDVLLLSKPFRKSDLAQILRQAFAGGVERG